MADQQPSTLDVLQQALEALETAIKAFERTESQIGSSPAESDAAYKAHHAIDALRAQIGRGESSPGRDESAWLIEMPHTGGAPIYWTGIAGREFSAEAAQALRFSREQDAQRMLDYLDSIALRRKGFGGGFRNAALPQHERVIADKSCYVIREHAWIATAGSPA